MPGGARPVEDIVGSLSAPAVRRLPAGSGRFLWLIFLWLLLPPGLPQGSDGGGRCAFFGPAAALALPEVDVNDSDEALLNDPLLLGDEYSDYKRGKGAKGGSVRPKHNLFEKIILYLPNRLLDLIDIVKADVGIGPSYGAVVRVTSYGQIGYRDFNSWSLRAGLHGRQSPVFLEKVKESGFIINYRGSLHRKPDEFELGAGVDVGIAGAYVGFAPEQLFDFVGGLFGFDLLEDDL